MILNLLNQIWIVWCQMAPFLILGFAVAGALYIWIKPSFVQRHLGSGRFSSVLKTTLLGIPLPLCSCGVIPVAASLRRQGASKGATAAFLLATPQTGVDSIAVTYSLLGGFFAIFRPLTALVTGIAGGMIVSAFDRENSRKDKRGEAPNSSPAGGIGTESSETTTTIADEGCCSSGACAVPDAASNGSLKQGLLYGLVTLPADIGRALAIGVVIAGAISAFAPPDLFQKLPGGIWLQMLFMMIVGIPLYVCATASVPVAAALILKGISPGAALVFLITGPATNAAAIATIWKIMGRKTAIIYLGVVAVFALLSGFAADLILNSSITIERHVHHVHGLKSWEIISGILLAIILANAYRPRRKPAGRTDGTIAAAAKTSTKNGSTGSASATDRSTTGGTAPDQTATKGQLSFNVSGMHCSHCASTIKQNLESTPGVSRVDVSLETGMVVVHGLALDSRALGKIIVELGYEV